ncbi:MAG TPA: Sir2 family NAD-dependent protein deacetylase [Flavisolibacter sp.]|jgi:NAD-dependent deacetylase|nr:Sir2 family NAD-dependent protein deacetylase [Flavisolibacter sp.]
MKKKLVVLTGAGISAESGLQTFRDADGLWEGFDLNEVATATAWRRNPGIVLDFYNARREGVLAAQPNEAHKALAALEQFFDVTIVTQNIDDLHERGGSTNVLHLHGEIVKMRSCNNDERLYDCPGAIRLGDKAEDGGQLRPHIVWFEEPVPMIEQAVEIVRRADIFVVIGTSLAVYPAAGLVNYAPWEIPKFIIDKKAPSTSSLYNLTVIEKSATEGVRELQALLKDLG